MNDCNEKNSNIIDDSEYRLTGKQLHKLIKSEAALMKTEEQERKYEEKLLKAQFKNAPRYVSVPKNTIIARIAGGFIKIFELKWKLEKDTNIAKRKKADIKKYRELEVARMKGKID